MTTERLPKFLHAPVAHLRRWLLSDGFPLFILGSEMVVTGLDYLSRVYRTTRYSSLHPIENVITPEGAGYLWLGLGILCYFGAIFPRSRFAAWVVGLGVTTNIVWGGSTLVANVFVFNGGYGYGAFVRYISIAALVIYIIWLKEVLRWNQLPSREEVDRVLHGYDS